MPPKTRHHVLHEKPSWNSRPEAARLRGEPTLIPRIERLDHNRIHENCPHVPLLGSYALRNVLSQFEPGRDTFESIDHLLIAIEAGTRHPKSHLIERQLGELTIHAIETQIPYLEDALGDRHNATVIDLASHRLKIVE